MRRFDADLLRLESLVGTSERDLELVNEIFRMLHTLKGSAAMLELHHTSALAHKLESLCEPLRAEDSVLSHDLVALLFEGRDALSDLIESGIEGTESSAPDELIARIDGFVERGGAHVAHLRSNEGSVRALSRSIRVEVARLDVLLNLVGELVIERTRINELISGLVRSDLPSELIPLVRDLRDAIEHHARTIAQMQDGVMSVRMIPIGTVFERFTRLVHDLAAARGKEIELAIEGASTELDKAIVDEIGEPLLHLIRNSIDHGIESPQARLTKGKTRSGRIELFAAHQGGQVVIRVTDDGAGIDVEAVRARAIADGLMTAGETRSHAELLELIFIPGLSTAAAVSDISGRGIGMDVVRETIGRLSGRIEVESEAARGTTIVIRLPLTLAIIEALLVRVAGQLYAIPLDTVIETRRVHEPGKDLPLVHLAEFFELSGDDRDRGPTRVAVVSVHGRRLGLIVDDFIGDQEIVIKPLSPAVGAIPGISGGAILGSGEIALIIDVNALARDAAPQGRALFGSGRT